MTRQSGYGSWVTHQDDITPDAAQDDTQAAPSDTTTETATEYWRPLWGIASLVGFVLCATPAIAFGLPIGIGFGIKWLCAPVVQVAEVQARTEARQSGSGGMSTFVAMVLVVLIGALALAAMLGVTEATR